MNIGVRPALAAGLWLVLSATSIQASPQSHALSEQGAAALQARDFKTALDRFDAAATADPSDLTALFFQGVALNRLGRSGEALTKLADAQRRGLKRVDLHLEIGYAQAQTGDWANALTQLRRYEALEPGKGFTQELLGSAYYGAGNLEEAKKAFILAAQRDPALTPTAELYLARIAHRQGGKQEANDRVARILRDSPDSAAGRLVRQLAASPAPANALTFNAALGVGYNSNVIGLGEGIPLPPFISHKSASFERVEFGPTYTLHPDAQSALALGYGFAGDFYNGYAAAELQDHVLSATYGRSLSDGWTMRVGGGAEFSFLGGSDYRDGYTASAALGRSLNEDSSLELAVGAGHYDYRFAVPVPSQNRSGNQFSIGPNYYLALGDRALLRFSYAYSVYQAQGADFSNNSNAFTAGITADLGMRFTGDLGFTYSRDRYDHPNSAATNFLSRSDDIYNMGVKVVRPIDRTWRLFAQAGYVRGDSNIAFYNYRQVTALTGVAASF